jgi:hypothetical protein
MHGLLRPHLLDTIIVFANGVIQRHIGSQAVDVVPARLEIKLIDVLAVAEFTKGEQRDLDTETAASRSQPSFLQARTVVVTTLMKTQHLGQTEALRRCNPLSPLARSCYHGSCGRNPEHTLPPANPGGLA